LADALVFNAMALAKAGPMNWSITAPIEPA
jgi:hypothetical protein